MKLSSLALLVFVTMTTAGCWSKVTKTSSESEQSQNPQEQQEVRTSDGIVLRIGLTHEIKRSATDAMQRRNRFQYVVTIDNGAPHRCWERTFRGGVTGGCDRIDDLSQVIFTGDPQLFPELALAQPGDYVEFSFGQIENDQARLALFDIISFRHENPAVRRAHIRSPHTAVPNAYLKIRRLIDNMNQPELERSLKLLRASTQTD
jgi:hypothetical protein